MRSKNEIEERLKFYKDRKELFDEVYDKLRSEIPNCPNQFETQEYKLVLTQIGLLMWVLNQ